MAASRKLVVFWVVAPCSLVHVYRRFSYACRAITAIMEAASTSEMSGNFYQTTRYNSPEDSHIQERQVCERVT
jgi:hypothetical protein